MGFLEGTGSVMSGVVVVMDAGVSSEFIGARKAFFTQRESADKGFFACMSSNMASLGQSQQ